MVSEWWRPTDDALLAHAEVGELAVSLGVEQDVVELEVAVDDAVLVQELQRQGDFRRVEPARAYSALVQPHAGTCRRTRTRTDH